VTELAKLRLAPHSTSSLAGIAKSMLYVSNITPEVPLLSKLSRKDLRVTFGF
jgi:hypothetical protein